MLELLEQALLFQARPFQILEIGVDLPLRRAENVERLEGQSEAGHRGQDVFQDADEVGARLRFRVVLERKRVHALKEGAVIRENGSGEGGEALARRCTADRLVMQRAGGLEDPKVLGLYPAEQAEHFLAVPAADAEHGAAPQKGIVRRFPKVGRLA